MMDHHSYKHKTMIPAGPVICPYKSKLVEEIIAKMETRERATRQPVYWALPTALSEAQVPEVISQAQ